MGEIWQEVINLVVQILVFLHGLTGSYGLAIIVLTLVVRTLFLPLGIRSTRQMRQMQVDQARLKPQLDALKKKHGNDRQRLLEEQQKLYKEHNVNPMASLGGCLPLLIQMPIWIALYTALLTLSGRAEFGASFLWIPSLGQKETFPYLLTIFTVISQWAISKMSATQAADSQTKSMNSMMQLTMPLMMGFFAFQVPAGLVLYWVTTNIFQFFQQLYTTGWGELWPSRARQVAGVVAVIPSGNGDKGDKSTKAIEASVPEAEAPAAKPARVGRNGHSPSEDGRQRQVPLLTESTPSVLKDGLRIYTLQPENDNGGDYTAEEASANMDESIARAKGQNKAKRKRRKG
ncbi:MAG: membrane protein insertase YidC [Chloroflexi bacterium]|nr:membrane protein insertase YidC [Chloroflexota bacterium]